MNKIIEYKGKKYNVSKFDNESVSLVSLEKPNKVFTITKEQYNRLCIHIDSIKPSSGNNTKQLVTFYNDLIDFSAFQYKPYLKLIDKNNKKKCIYVADEVGVGKTFSSGVIISELLFSKRISIDRPIMIICPNMLCQKWQEVLNDFFGLSSKIIKTFDQLSNISIISFDAISRIKEQDIEVPQLELLIIDEAHNVSNTRFSKIMKFRKESQYTVLLSATPLSGKVENSIVQMELLFNGDVDSEFSFEEEGIYFNRTLKEEIRKEEVMWKIQNVPISNKMLEKYILICEHIFKGKNTLLKFVGLNMIESSPAAAKAYIDYLIQLDDDKIMRLAVSSLMNLEEIQEYGYENISDLVSNDDLKEIIEEKDINIKNIRGLISELQEDIEDDTLVDQKLEALKKIISKNKKKELDGQSESIFYKKCIVFVIYNETAHYLNQNIEESILINGEISTQAKLERFNKFKESDDYNVLIITNVACEGQDMDFCNTIINYDLTYNPVQLAQRKGRIDRFKVKKNDLFIYNFLTNNIDPTVKQIEAFVDDEIDNLQQYNNSIYSVILRKLKAINDETGIYYNVVDSKGKSTKAINKGNSEQRLVGMFNAFFKDNKFKDIEDIEDMYNKIDYTFINEVLKSKNIGINREENYQNNVKDNKYSIRIDKRNKDILKSILDGGTINSHLIYNK